MTGDIDRRLLDYLVQTNPQKEGEAEEDYRGRIWSIYKREFRENAYNALPQFNAPNPSWNFPNLPLPQNQNIQAPNYGNQRQPFDQFSLTSNQQPLFAASYNRQDYVAPSQSYATPYTRTAISPGYGETFVSNQDSFNPLQHRPGYPLLNLATEPALKTEPPSRTPSTRPPSPPVAEVTNTGVEHIVKMPVPKTFIPSPLLNRGHKPRRDPTPFACNKCTETAYFSNNFDLARHIERIHESQGYNAYRCLVCEQRYARLDGARKHLKKSCKPENKERNARRWMELGYQFFA